MDNFADKVEMQIQQKSTNELQAIILRMAKKLPESYHSMFLDIIENKHVVIDKEPAADLEEEKILSGINDFIEKIGSYEIEARYNYYEYWHGDFEYEGWELINDDGFINDFINCYKAAETLLINARFPAAATAFRLLFDAIYKFDEENAYCDDGDLSLDTFFSEKWINLDYRRLKALRGYSSLMSQDKNLPNELEAIFSMYSCRYNAIMLEEALNAGSEPIPNLEAVLLKWLKMLYTKPPETASPYVKEVAILLKNRQIMIDFVSSTGLKSPAAYLDLCACLSIEKAPVSEIISYGKTGLENTDTNANNREKLATFVADLSKEAGDTATYEYAILERFYTSGCLRNYVPILATNSADMNALALAVLSQKNSNSADNYIIQILNQNYDAAFNAIKRDKKSLGWSDSLKGDLFPFFLGLLSRFDSDAVIVKSLITSRFGEIGDTAYKLLYQNLGEITVEQDNEWYKWCVKEIEKRVDGIVSNQHRGAYNRAAELLVALCEVSDLRKAERPSFLLDTYMKKYPRHSAFKGEVRTVLGKSRLGFLL
ncbi:MAG: hypothetical protein FWC32_07885 [Firmicutes bacterium]|nr:hypothetical protein [Bacillota bacterium]